MNLLLLHLRHRGLLELQVSCLPELTVDRLTIFISVLFEVESLVFRTSRLYVVILMQSLVLLLLTFVQNFICLSDNLFKLTSLLGILQIQRLKSLFLFL